MIVRKSCVKVCLQLLPQNLYKANFEINSFFFATASSLFSCSASLISLINSSSAGGPKQIIPLSDESDDIGEPARDCSPCSYSACDSDSLILLLLNFKCSSLESLVTGAHSNAEGIIPFFKSMLSYALFNIDLNLSPVKLCLKSGLNNKTYLQCF